MFVKQYIPTHSLLMAATIFGVGGCSTDPVTISNGTTLPMRELTREVTWNEDADLLMLQMYARGQAIEKTCEDLNEVERRGLEFWQTELEAQRDAWLFPNIKDCAKQDWMYALQVLTQHYIETADKHFCDKYAKDLRKLGKDMRTNNGQ